MKKTSFFWMRRDLRLEDNVGLSELAQSAENIQIVFIFDTEIIDELPVNDHRITFIYNELQKINEELKKYKSSLIIKKGNPVEIWNELSKNDTINAVYWNKDYEPYAIQRDKTVKQLLASKGIVTNSFKDQVIFEENDVLKSDGNPYVVYTPYKNQWLNQFNSQPLKVYQKPDGKQFSTSNFKFPLLNEIGFEESEIKVKPINLNRISDYDKIRDIPSIDGTSYVSPHLRFGTIGIRQLIQQIKGVNQTYLNELIWREFFMQILFQYPKVVNGNFRNKYDGIQWRNDENEFKKWCEGKTGYPIVDAGMRELNETGYMHNRVRMITASFLCKHLLIDWQWGEAYFAEKLFDYELSSNNGNWQWSAGTGCDAAPYFRVFNPIEQLKKFDPEMKYVKKWIPELLDGTYVSQMVDHKAARIRALETYKKGIEG